jgi:hypothetical protein
MNKEPNPIITQTIHTMVALKVMSAPKDSGALTFCMAPVAIRIFAVSANKIPPSNAKIMRDNILMSQSILVFCLKYYDIKRRFLYFCNKKGRLK